MKRTIKGLRSDMGITQKEMAERLGISLPRYQRYERYEVIMDADVFTRLGDICKVKDLRDIRTRAI